MDLGKYKKAMRPKKYLDGRFVIYDETIPDASDAQLGARDTFAIGGGVIEGNDLGTREGFEKINYRGDPEIQNKAEVLATLDQAFELMRQGKSQEEVYDIMKQMTDRTKQAGGGLAYLMGL